jgi:hypothetical protein
MHMQLTIFANMRLDRRSATWEMLLAILGSGFKYVRKSYSGRMIVFGCPRRKEERQTLRCLVDASDTWSSAKSVFALVFSRFRAM